MCLWCGIRQKSEEEEEEVGAEIGSFYPELIRLLCSHFLKNVYRDFFPFSLLCFISVNL